MKEKSLNLIIIDNDAPLAMGLQSFLKRRFKSGLAITVFSSGDQALTHIDHRTDIVILDHDLITENGNDILKKIKIVNPLIEIIMLSSNQEVSNVIESFRLGARDYVIKENTGAWGLVSKIIYKLVVYPVHLLAREFGISKFLVIFIITFLLIGLVVFLALKIYR